MYNHGSCTAGYNSKSKAAQLYIFVSANDIKMNKVINTDIK